jgi:hypothetical protein
MLPPFVRWLYDTPIPRHSAPYGLLPNMSEKLRNHGREPRSGFSRLSVSLVEPCPRLTRVLTLILGWGMMGVEQKTPLVVFPPRASPRVILLQRRARFLFDDGAAEREIGFYKRSVMTSANSPFAERPQRSLAAAARTRSLSTHERLTSSQATLTECLVTNL